MRLLIALSIFLVIMSLFSYIVREVLEGETLPRDQQILLFINSFASPALNTMMVLVTKLGNVITILVATVILVTLLAKRRLWPAAFLVSFSMLGSIILNIILKLLFARPRPELWPRLIDESTYSFPSGHALLTSTLALAVVLAIWRTQWRWYVVIASVIYVFAVGFSRLYLGVHYPTDIIAGWCVGIGWTLIVASIIGVIRWKRGLSVSSNPEREIHT